MTTHPVKRRKKLIEVAIPHEAINAASAGEKSIRQGDPSTSHLWWTRRPLAAARAVIFCQMVDDPSAVPEEFPTEEAQENERLRLFALISELVQWENTTNKELQDPGRLASCWWPSGQRRRAARGRHLRLPSLIPAAHRSPPPAGA